MPNKLKPTNSKGEMRVGCLLKHMNAILSHFSDSQYNNNNSLIPLHEIGYFKFVIAYPKTTDAEEFVVKDPSKILAKCIKSDT